MSSNKEIGIQCRFLGILLDRVKYNEKYGNYYRDNFCEKSLEHFFSYKLLDLNKEDIFVDIASEQSLLGEILHRLTGCTSYSQDIMLEPGVHGNMIGSDASDIPVAEGFFNAAAATCSLEHFENDSDIKFMHEMERVLVRGGKVIIIPLYLYIREACQTDPNYSVPGNVNFDKDADIYCARDWGNRHARFYSPRSLYERLIKPNKNMDFRVYLIENSVDIDNSIYCRFILVGTKKE